MKISVRSAVLGVALLAAALPLVMIAHTGVATAQDNRDVPYVSTPQAVVEGMLDMAAIQPGERLVDLGSGDGRIPIAAARRGASALGVEISQRLVVHARDLARLHGFEDRARFVRDDLFQISVREADVVTLYLLPQINERLRPKLLTEMKPGARVVSHAFDMGDWPPDDHQVIEEKNVYLWTIPAIAGGDWIVTRPDGTTVPLSIEQRYSRVSGTLGEQTIADARLTGAALSFRVGDTDYRGTVGDRTIVPDAADAGWRAVRAE